MGDVWGEIGYIVPGEENSREKGFVNLFECYTDPHNFYERVLYISQDLLFEL